MNLCKVPQIRRTFEVIWHMLSFFILAFACMRIRTRTFQSTNCLAPAVMLYCRSYLRILIEFSCCSGRRRRRRRRQAAANCKTRGNNLLLRREKQTSFSLMHNSQPKMDITLIVNLTIQLHFIIAVPLRSHQFWQGKIKKLWRSNPIFYDFDYWIAI